jgi:hypothetical protein
MTSLARRLTIAAVCLGGLVAILFLADVELARHHTQTQSAITLLSKALPAGGGHRELFVYVKKTEPPGLGESLSEPLTKQLEARGASVRLIPAPPTAFERPALTLQLRAAPLGWTPLRATATVTAKLTVLGASSSEPTARGEVRVTDVTNGLTSRAAYLRHLAEGAAAGIARSFDRMLADAPAL